MPNVTVIHKIDSFKGIFDRLLFFRNHGLVAHYWPRGGETAKEYIPVTHNIALTGNPDWIKTCIELEEENVETRKQPDRPGADGVDQEIHS